MFRKSIIFLYILVCINPPAFSDVDEKQSIMYCYAQAVHRSYETTGRGNDPTEGSDLHHLCAANSEISDNRLEMGHWTFHGNGFTHANSVSKKRVSYYQREQTYYDPEHNPGCAAGFEARRRTAANGTDPCQQQVSIISLDGGIVETENEVNPPPQIVVRRELLIIIRGTSGFIDYGTNAEIFLRDPALFSNINSSLSPSVWKLNNPTISKYENDIYKNVQVNNGFLSHFYKVNESVYSKVRQLEQWAIEETPANEKRVIGIKVVGHSLGASAAEILGAMLYFRYRDHMPLVTNLKKRRLESTDIEVFSFNPARTGKQKFALLNHIWSRTCNYNIRTFHHNGDPVDAAPGALDGTSRQIYSDPIRDLYDDFRRTSHYFSRYYSDYPNHCRYEGELRGSFDDQFRPGSRATRPNTQNTGYSETVGYTGKQMIDNFVTPGLDDPESFPHHAWHQWLGVPNNRLIPKESVPKPDPRRIFEENFDENDLNALFPAMPIGWESVYGEFIPPHPRRNASIYPNGSIRGVDTWYVDTSKDPNIPFTQGYDFNISANPDGSLQLTTMLDAYPSELLGASFPNGYFDNFTLKLEVNVGTVYSWSVFGNNGSDSYHVVSKKPEGGDVISLHQYVSEFEPWMLGLTEQEVFRELALDYDTFILGSDGAVYNYLERPGETILQKLSKTTTGYIKMADQWIMRQHAFGP